MTAPGWLPPVNPQVDLPATTLAPLLRFHFPAATSYGTGVSAGLSSGVQVAAGDDPMSLAQVGLEVASVEGATLQVQSIAASLGGYVERLTTIGVAEQSRSEITIKVPQDQFDRTMVRVQGLGVVQYRSLGSEGCYRPPR